MGFPTVIMHAAPRDEICAAPFQQLHVPRKTSCQLDECDDSSESSDVIWSDGGKKALDENVIYYAIFESETQEVDLLVPTKVTGIITQGAKDFGHVQFVGSYKLAYSDDGERWTVYQDEKQRKDKVFQGNFDNDTHRKNVIDPPIYARHIRILPWSWYGRITLRSELLGCTEEE
ncbi:EGF-like repeat and discoidin I-like domain-containing protein 3 [Fukomys damarensis]|uniref:EGF-like repeat and discoidin I-like domain-containing protein 3 n=1 Tax=Fukomys damarensis TaxID=885580 RepID=A0A091DY95_FUKDA|nr:EGF-like repeat and discoidin I-like domain-containing protein 3 [Fukomys damarensis]